MWRTVRDICADMSTARDTGIYDAAILGAGASGLVCAMAASARGRRVLLIEHGAKPGRKLSITGGGKCNLSNRHITPLDYSGENPDFCRSALSRFDVQDMLDFAAGAGISLEEREHGQLFCIRSAKDVVNFLVAQCRKTGCALALEEKILGVELTTADTESPLFTVETSRGVYRCAKVVVATGGPAWPQVGATGTGYEIARSFGHAIIPIRPALCGFVMRDNWPLATLSGVSLPAAIRVIPPCRDEADRAAAKHAPGQSPAAGTLPLLFTHRGLSGPAALQASLYWRKGAVLRIDFLPSVRTEALFDAAGAGKLLCRTILKRHLPGRFCDALLPEALGVKKTAELSRRERTDIEALVHAHDLVPAGTEGFSRAEVTAGGVSTRDVSSRSMESSRQTGLYFCGEVLDVTGRLGGYNLHWAFASGMAAGNCL